MTMAQRPADRQQHRLYAATYDRMVRGLERARLGTERRALFGPLEGRILDVGAGTGANLPFYPANSRVTAAEPDPAMRRRLVAKRDRTRADVEIIDAVAEHLPFEDRVFDAVVFTLVLCTVTDPDKALAEAFRVLKPGGVIGIIEHVAGDGLMLRWQNVIDPLWSRTQAGCHVNRQTSAAVTRAGFLIGRSREFRAMPVVVPASPMVAMVGHRPI